MSGLISGPMARREFGKLLAAGLTMNQAKAQLGAMGMFGTRRSVFSSGPLLVTDDFNRASLGSNWTQESTGTVTISGSIQITGSGAVTCYARWNAAAPTANQFSRLTIVTPAFAGPVCRQQAGADTSYNVSTSGTSFYVNRRIAGVDTELLSGTLIRASSHLLELRVSGVGATVTVQLFVTPDGDVDPLNLTQLGADIPDTDPARIVTAGYLGVVTFGTVCRADNFVGGDL